MNKPALICIRRYGLLCLWLLGILLMSQPARAIIDYKLIAAWMQITQGNEASNAYGYYVTASDKIMEAGQGQSLMVYVSVEQGAHFVSGSAEAVLNGEGGWQSLGFDMEQARAGRVAVPLPKVDERPELQWMVVRLRLSGSKGTQETRVLVVIRGQNVEDVQIFDIGGTLQAKNKLAKSKKHKSCRDPFTPVIDQVKEEAAKSRLVVFLTSKEVEDRHMIQSWFQQHGLPPGPILMPRVRRFPDAAADDKAVMLGALGCCVRVTQAWGNGVLKDVMPYMRKRVGLVHHISWPGSDESSIAKLVQCKMEQCKIEQYTLLRRVPLCPRINGELLPAVWSTYQLSDVKLVSAPCEGVVCVSSNDYPDDDPDNPPRLFYSAVETGQMAETQSLFNQWVLEHQQGRAQPLWQGLTMEAILRETLPLNPLSSGPPPHPY